MAALCGGSIAEEAALARVHMCGHDSQRTGHLSGHSRSGARGGRLCWTFLPPMAPGRALTTTSSLWSAEAGVWLHARLAHRLHLERKQLGLGLRLSAR